MKDCSDGKEKKDYTPYQSYWGKKESTFNTKKKAFKGHLPVFTDILCATIFPPNTASAVQSACPKVPPIITPRGC
jgi:hypothetical protein